MGSSAPESHQIIQFLAEATAAAVLLGLSGLTLTATFISLVLATPLLVFFSPILVLAVSGFIFSGGCWVAALSALTKIYNYVAAGTHPYWLDQLDYARTRLASKAAGDAEETAKEDAQEVESNKAQEAMQAS